MRTNISSRIIATALLAAGLLLSGFSASAAIISLVPVAQNVGSGSTFSVDIFASGLPAGTSGGALDVSWNAGDMTLDSVYLATTDLADSAGSFGGNWDPVSSSFSGPGTIGIGSLTGLFVGSLTGLQDFQAIGRLNFTLSDTAVVSNSVVSAAQALVGGTWSAWDGVNPPYDFTNTYESAVINPTTVPLPAALWLFGSGMLGLVGVARRRGRAAPGYGQV